MSYSINVTFKISAADGVITPLLPQQYILPAETNPIAINEGETVDLYFKADGMYFEMQRRKGATATGADLSWNCPSPYTDATITLSNATDNVEITIIAIVKVPPQVVPKPFLFQIAAPVDTRLVLTKKEMCDAEDDYLPDTYFALCKDDGHFYLYNKKTEPNELTGRYTLITDIVEHNIKSIDGGEILEDPVIEE
jgi:hypothetical protein